MLGPGDDALVDEDVRGDDELLRELDVGSAGDA